MTYVDSFSSALASIGQIQATFSSLPTTSSSSNFEAVMQQVASISELGGTPGPGATDLSGSYGWPLAEGNPLASTGTSGGVGSSLATGSPLTADSSLTPSTSLAVSTSVAVGQPGTPGATSVAGQSAAQTIVSQAQTFLGVPYLWGGTNPSQGVDCSGLVQDVYAKVGISLPRTSQEQATTGVAVPSLADAQPGDLVFFPGSDGTASAPGHVGIYIGNGQMIDAPYTGANVRVDAVGNPTAIRRVTDVATAGVNDASSAPTTYSASPTAYAASPTAYQGDFASAASTYNVPEQLLSAVAATESSYQPAAVSGSGAEGLMQIMPSTASSLGVDAFNPTQAISGAAKLLSSYHTQFGTWPLALAAYNAGPGAVQQYSGIPPYPETQAYVQTVLNRAGMEDQ